MKIKTKGNDCIIAKGEVNIKVFEGEKLIDHIHEKNLVVTLGKTNIAKLLGGDAAGKAITQVAVGENGIAPAVGDVGPLMTQFAKAIDTVSYPSANQVQFDFDIDNSEANGLTIREFGLLNVDGVLFARKNRSADIVKTIAIRLVGTWTITIN